MDELLARARTELEPPWDDLREARVLSRVLDEAGLAKELPAWRRPWLRAGFGGLAVAAVLAGVWLFSSAGSVPRQAGPAPAEAVTATATPEASSLLALADGSKAFLTPGAEVQALEQSPRLVRLAQRVGTVRYEVKPDTQRPFTVVARGVEVRVIGTVFTVAVDPEGVRVSVERGLVAVTSGTRAVELSPGENLRLSSRDLPSEVSDKPVASASPVALTSPSAAPAGSGASPAVLMAEADAARARGDLAAAERVLGRLVAEHAGSPQATSARFSLGRIQSARGNFAGAARTFEALRQRAPSGPLAEDALAEAANAWALAGQSAQASALSTQYLARFPQGPHAERMRRLGAK